jgi:hypothetical protein
MGTNMARPQFQIRSIVIVVVIAALVLGLIRERWRTAAVGLELELYKARSVRLQEEIDTNRRGVNHDYGRKSRDTPLNTYAEKP